jgi:site-specific DNA-adenine methylase
VKNKVFISAPLPFQGQKRMHIKSFSAVIEKAQPELVIDLFGGRGFLSYTAKRVCPSARVVYNDYDNYRERLKHIPETNALLTEFREMRRNVPRKMRLDASSREAVFAHLAAADKAGYVDWITLSSSLCFAMRYKTNFQEFINDTLYNRVRLSDYDATGYLDGLEIVRYDYRELLYQYRNTPDVLFLADPPYLSTDTSTYSSAAYWHLRDYLDVIKELQGLRFVYFTSNKSQIIDLCEWMSANFNVPNLFAGAQRNVYNAHTSHSSTYQDIMLWKLN